MTTRKAKAPGWAELLDAVGGRGQLARLLEVAESTIYRWAAGESRPTSVVRDALNRIARQHGVAEVYPRKETDHG